MAPCTVPLRPSLSACSPAKYKVPCTDLASVADAQGELGAQVDHGGRRRRDDEALGPLRYAGAELAPAAEDAVDRDQVDVRGALEGERDPEQLAELAHVRVLRHKREALERAVVGRLSEVLRFVVQQQLQHVHDLEAQIATCDAKVAVVLRFAPPGAK